MIPELTDEQVLSMVGNMRLLLERCQIYIEDLEHQVGQQQAQLQEFFEQRAATSESPEGLNPVPFGDDEPLPLEPSQ